MKKLLTSAALVALALGLAAPGRAQSEKPLQKLWSLFGGKSNPPAATATSNSNSTTTMVHADTSQRPAEIQIELAWYADPITCPYGLVAATQKGDLQLHGTVPSKAVHDHAVRVARLQTQRKVVDMIQENPGAMVRAVRVPMQQLQQSTQAALQNAFPHDQGQLKVQCYGDGRVTVTGRVTSWEHKLAVSQTLQRVQGTSAVANQAMIVPHGTGQIAQTNPTPAPLRPTPTANPPSSYFQSMPNGAQNSPPTAVQNVPPVRVGTPQNNPYAMQQPSNPFQAVSMPKNPNVPPVTLEQPQPTPTVAQQSPLQPTTAEPGRGVVIMDEPAAPAVAPTPQFIKRRIEETVPGVSDVTVTFTSPKNAKVDVRCRPTDNTDQIIGQIISLRELESIQVDLNIRVPEK